MIRIKCSLTKTPANLLDRDDYLMSKKTPTQPFEKLISSPWASSPDNSYYGDPRYVEKEQHGLEDLKHDKAGEDGVEKVVILGYN